jgi:hypothetical protein
MNEINRAGKTIMKRKSSGMKCKDCGMAHKGTCAKKTAQIIKPRSVTVKNTYPPGTYFPQQPRRGVPKTTWTPQPPVHSLQFIKPIPKDAKPWSPFSGGLVPRPVRTPRPFWKKGIKTTGKTGGKSNRLGGGGRFLQVERAAARSGARNPAAVAAAVGRRSLGAGKMARLAAAGRRRASKKSSR